MASVHQYLPTHGIFSCVPRTSASFSNSIKSCSSHLFCSTTFGVVITPSKSRPQVFNNSPSTVHHLLSAQRQCLLLCFLFQRRAAIFPQNLWIVSPVDADSKFFTTTSTCVSKLHLPKHILLVPMIPLSCSRGWSLLRKQYRYNRPATPCHNPTVADYGV